MKENAEPMLESSLGHQTLADLSDCLCMTDAPETDAWGILRPPFREQAARLSAELSADVYDLDIRPWARAGWNDCTFVVEDDVIPLDKDSDSKLAALESEWRRRRARSRIRGVNPLTDLVRAARQMMVTDMSKSVVMTRMLPDGRPLVAIAFIGTTAKVYDWFSNFKFSNDTGLHNGFLALARRFEALTGQVSLPALAASMGEASLTLAQVIERAATPDSPYLFWLCGHSQGGALVQTFVHLLLSRGVSPLSLRAYSFAAPSVAVCGAVQNAASYPIYNIINSDDVVPRVGSQVRLGMDCVFFADDAFRSAHYGVKEENRAAFEWMQFAATQMRQTSDAFCWGIAVLRLLGGMDEKDENAKNLLTELLPMASLLEKLNLRPAEVAEFGIGKLTASARLLCGEPPDSALCARYEDMLRTFAAEFGARPMAQVMMDCMRIPHGIRPDKHTPEGVVPPYIAIVRKYLWALEKGVWTQEAPALCQNERGETLLPAGRAYLLEFGTQALPAAPRGNVEELENNGYEE